MVHVLLLILKIIGITLLAIIGLVLFLILLVLNVPIRYSGKVDKSDEFTAVGVVSWLLHIVHLTAGYDENGVAVSLRLFGFKIFPRKEKKKKTRRKKKNRRKESGKESRKKTAGTEEKPEEIKENPEKITENPTIITENPTEIKENPTEIKENPTDSVSEITTVSDTVNDSGTGDKEDKKELRKQRKKEKKENQKSKKKRKAKKNHEVRKNKKDGPSLADKLKNLYNKLKRLQDKWERIQNIIDDVRVGKGFTKAKEQLFKALKHILPRRITGEVEYGFEDPSTTGYITAVLGAIYGLYGEDFSIRPDFENSVLKCNVKFRGKIRLIALAVMFLRVWLDKNCRYAYKLIRSEIEGTDENSDNSSKEDTEEL